MHTKRSGELWSKIRDLTKLKTNCFHTSKLNNSDNQDGKYMKIKFNADNSLLVKKML